MLIEVKDSGRASIAAVRITTQTSSELFQLGRIAHRFQVSRTSEGDGRYYIEVEAAEVIKALAGE